MTVIYVLICVHYGGYGGRYRQETALINKFIKATRLSTYVALQIINVGLCRYVPTLYVPYVGIIWNIALYAVLN
jgi:hypothetical protein